MFIILHIIRGVARMTFVRTMAAAEKEQAVLATRFGGQAVILPAVSEILPTTLNPNEDVE